VKHLKMANILTFVKFEVLTAVLIYLEIFWIVKASQPEDLDMKLCHTCSKLVINFIRSNEMNDLQFKYFMRDMESECSDG